MEKIMRFLAIPAMFIALVAASFPVLAWENDWDYESGWNSYEECDQTGDFHAYRSGDCSQDCDLNFRQWSNRADMQRYIPEGSTIRVDGGIDVYIVKYKNGKMFKRLVLSPSVFENYGHLRWGDVLNVSPDVLNAYTTSDLVRSVETGNIYRLYPSGDCGIKRMVVAGGCFWNRMDFDSIYQINGYDEDSYDDASDLE